MRRIPSSCFFMPLVAIVIIINPHYSHASEVGFMAVSLEASTGNFAAVAAGDIDGDGYAEILSGRRDGQEGLFLFTYNGKTWVQQQVTPSGEYGGVALADIEPFPRGIVIGVETDGG